MNAHRNTVQSLSKISFCPQLVELQKTAAIKRTIVCSGVFPGAQYNRYKLFQSVCTCEFIELNFIVEFIFHLYSRPFILFVIKH